MTRRERRVLRRERRAAERAAWLAHACGAPVAHGRVLGIVVLREGVQSALDVRRRGRGEPHDQCLWERLAALHTGAELVRLARRQVARRLPTLSAWMAPASWHEMGRAHGRCPMPGDVRAQAQVRADQWTVRWLRAHESEDVS